MWSCALTSEEPHTYINKHTYRQLVVVFDVTVFNYNVSGNLTQIKAEKVVKPFNSAAAGLLVQLPTAVCVPTVKPTSSCLGFHLANPAEQWEK